MMSNEKYRYGYQKQDVEYELWGGEASFFKYRISDNRLGRFFAVDPLYKKYPYNSNYAFSENRVIDMIELEGGECIPPSSYGSNTAAAIHNGNKQLVTNIVNNTIHTGECAVNTVSLFGTGVYNMSTVYIPQTFGFKGGTEMDYYTTQGKYKWGSYEGQQVAYNSVGHLTVEVVSAVATEGILRSVVTKPVVTSAVREDLAKNFLLNHGIPEKDLSSHLKYFNFNKGVYTKTISSADELGELVQYRIKTASGVGNYYAPKGTTPDAIGIKASDVVEAFSVKINEGEKIKVLVSKHSNNQPLYYRPTDTSTGGGTQIFSSEIEQKATFTPIPVPTQ